MYPFKEMNDAKKKKDQVTTFGGVGVDNDKDKKWTADDEEDDEEDDVEDGEENDDTGDGDEDDASSPLLDGTGGDATYGSADDKKKKTAKGGAEGEGKTEGEGEDAEKVKDSAADAKKVCGTVCKWQAGDPSRKTSFIQKSITVWCMRLRRICSQSYRTPHTFSLAHKPHTHIYHSPLQPYF